jgi:hypothetical protein
MNTIERFNDKIGKKEEVKMQFMHRTSKYMEMTKAIDDGDTEETPSLEEMTLSDSCSCISSEDLSISSSENCASKKGRRLTFNENVTVREFSLTVGDHPMCEDALPLSLDWFHADDYTRHIDLSRNRGIYYEFPPRLSFAERRQRLQDVACFDDDAFLNVANEHHNSSFHTIIKTVEFSNLLDYFSNSLLNFLSRPGVLEMAEDEEEALLDVIEENIFENDFDSMEHLYDEEQPPQIIAWKNNHAYQRSESFCV